MQERMGGRSDDGDPARDNRDQRRPSALLRNRRNHPAARAARGGARLTLSDRVFMRRLLLAVAIAAVAFAVFKLSDVLLLVFAAAIVGLGLDALAVRLRRLTGMPRGAAIAVSLLAILGVVAGIVAIFGTQIAAQLGQVSERVPEAIQRLLAKGDASSIRSLVQGSTFGDLVANALSWGSTLFGAAASLVLVIAGGVYFASDPGLYRRGLLALLPSSAQPAVADALEESGLALRRWFGGQLLAMVLVGLMTAVGLWLIGVPGYLGLGLIAGLTEFIPILGPIAGAVPAVLLASMQDWTTVLWVIGLFVVVQQVENNVILPVVTGKAVLMPAAVGLFGVVAAGVLLGPLGLLLGYPLTIVADVLIRRLYVEEALQRDVSLPSDKADD